MNQFIQQADLYKYRRMSTIKVNTFRVESCIGVYIQIEWLSSEDWCFPYRLPEASDGAIGVLTCGH